MSPRVRNGLIVAALHVAIVGSLGAKLLVDRAARPRVWVRSGPVDPNEPIRGRYVRLRVEAAVSEAFKEPVRDSSTPPSADMPSLGNVVLTVKNGELVALPSPLSTGVFARTMLRDGRRVAIVDPPLAYFIPEHVVDPSIRAPGEELWVEVTIPRRGAPRPIRLGVKKGGVLTPIDID